MPTTRVLVALLGLSLLLAASGARAQAQPPWIGGSALRSRIAVDAAGETWVGVWVDAPDVAVVPQVRTPMAVSLVVDVSGSMAGEKIANAQMAASSVIESLADGDIVSIYGFSNVVTEVSPPTVVSALSRAGLMQRVSLLVAGGGTNMYDGMQVGVSRIAQAPATHTNRRIFLISDGHANVGPSDPGSLGDLAARATEWGTQVTAIGVGYDYDPVALSSMVVRSAGRLHHLGNPGQMAAILEQEMGFMARSVALNARIEIQPAPGVTILEGATTGARVDGGLLRFPVGALIAGQRREVLFRVRIPGARLGTQPLGTARLVFQAPGAPAEQVQTAALGYQVVRARTDEAEVPRVAAMVAQHQASVAERQAAQLLEQGQRDQAVAALEAARAQLSQASTTYQFADAEIAGQLARRAEAMRTEAAGASQATSAPAARARSLELQAAPMAAEGY